MKTIILDSTPLGLFLQKRHYPQSEQCRQWLERHMDAGARIVVPEIVDYEVRRELLRLRKTASVAKLDAFNHAELDRYLPLNSRALKLAAQLWADARQKGVPTADPAALDIDVIVAAQILSEGLRPSDFVVATSNVAHLSRFVPAELWSNL